jgi:hypothetical protein
MASCAKKNECTTTAFPDPNFSDSASCRGERQILLALNPEHQINQTKSHCTSNYLIYNKRQSACSREQ